MIADDTNAIRDGMRKLAQAKVIAEAEAAKRAEADSKPTELRKPGELFPEAGAPFRGFFLGEDGDPVVVTDRCQPRYGYTGQFTFTVADCPTEPQSAAIERIAAEHRRNGTDPWDDVTLDGGSFMWGQL